MTYFMGKKNTDEEYDNVIEKLRSMLRGVVDKYDLCYVED